MPHSLSLVVSNQVAKLIKQAVRLPSVVEEASEIESKASNCGQFNCQRKEFHYNMFIQRKQSTLLLISH